MKRHICPNEWGRLPPIPCLMKDGPATTVALPEKTVAVAGGQGVGEGRSCPPSRAVIDVPRSSGRGRGLINFKKALDATCEVR